MLPAAYAEAIKEARDKVSLAKSELQKLGDECEHWEHTTPTAQTILRDSDEESDCGRYYKTDKHKCLISYCKTCGVKRTEFMESKLVEYERFWE